MPWIKETPPEIMEYIEATMRMPTTLRRIGWVPQSYVDQAVEELTPTSIADPNAAGNPDFAAEVAKLKGMSMDERKAYRHQQRMEAARRAYQRQRERDAAAGKPPVTKLD